MQSIANASLDSIFCAEKCQPPRRLLRLLTLLPTYNNRAACYFSSSRSPICRFRNRLQPHNAIDPLFSKLLQESRFIACVRAQLAEQDGPEAS
jgi:hypothetical protein